MAYRRINRFASLAADIAAFYPHTVEDRVALQDDIAQANRRGEITNKEAVRLLALMNRPSAMVRLHRLRSRMLQRTRRASMMRLARRRSSRRKASR